MFDHARPSSRGATSNCPKRWRQGSRRILPPLHPATAAARAAIDVMLGRRRVYANQCFGMHYPFLPADEYFDREHFPWLEQLESQTDASAPRRSRCWLGDAGLSPYVAMPPGTPRNIWTELNNSPAWSALHLWRDGERSKRLARARQRRRRPLRGFRSPASRGARRRSSFRSFRRQAYPAAHRGDQYARDHSLAADGAPRLRLPGRRRNARMARRRSVRVRRHDRTRGMERSDRDRAVLILDCWNPHLSEHEREMICRLFTSPTQQKNAVIPAGSKVVPLDPGYCPARNCDGKVTVYLTKVSSLARGRLRPRALGGLSEPHLRSTWGSVRVWAPACLPGERVLHDSFEIRVGTVLRAGSALTAWLLPPSLRRPLTRRIRARRATTDPAKQDARRRPRAAGGHRCGRRAGSRTRTPADQRRDRHHRHDHPQPGRRHGVAGRLGHRRRHPDPRHLDRCRRAAVADREQRRHRPAELVVVRLRHRRQRPVAARPERRLHPRPLRRHAHRRLSAGDDGQRNFVDINTIPRVDRRPRRRAARRRVGDLWLGRDRGRGQRHHQARDHRPSRQRFVGISQKGDNAEQRYSVTAGYGELDEQGFNVYVNGEYQKSDPLLVRDRGYPFNTADLSEICGTAAQGCLFNGCPQRSFRLTAAMAASRRRLGRRAAVQWQPDHADRSRRLSSYSTLRAVLPSRPISTHRDARLDPAKPDARATGQHEALHPARRSSHWGRYLYVQQLGLYRHNDAGHRLPGRPGQPVSAPITRISSRKGANVRAPPRASAAPAQPI